MGRVKVHVRSIQAQVVRRLKSSTFYLVSGERCFCQPRTEETCFIFQHSCVTLKEQLAAGLFYKVTFVKIIQS